MHSVFCYKEKFIWFQQIFIWLKDILFELNKCYLIKINEFKPSDFSFFFLINDLNNL